MRTKTTSQVNKLRLVNVCHANDSHRGKTCRKDSSFRTMLFILPRSRAIFRNLRENLSKVIGIDGFGLEPRVFLQFNNFVGTN